MRRYPTLAEINAEVDEIAICLAELSEGCPRLQHLELPALQSYRSTYSFTPDSQALAQAATATDRTWTFPALQHLDVSAWDCVDSESLGQFLQFTPTLRTVVARDCALYGAEIMVMIALEPQFAHVRAQLVMLDVTACHLRDDDDPTLMERLAAHSALLTSAIPQYEQPAVEIPSCLYRQLRPNDWDRVCQLKSEEAPTPSGRRFLPSHCCVCDSCSALRAPEEFSPPGHSGPCYVHENGFRLGGSVVPEHSHINDKPAPW